MAKFYIEKALVTGEGRKPAEAVFKPGLNFVIAPSNSGKSYIAHSLNFMFGFEEANDKPLHFSKTYGYDTFHLFLRTEKGDIVLRRKRGENVINLSGTDERFEHGDYVTDHKQKKNIDDVFLRLIGIDKTHVIRANKSGGTQALTWRSILHMFFLEQAFIDRDYSVFYTPGLRESRYAATSSKAAMLFLMSGLDAEKAESKESRQNRDMKRTAVIAYIKETVGRLAQREGELLKQRGAEPTDEFFQNEINAVAAELDALKKQMNEAGAKSKRLMHDIYANSNDLAECAAIAEQFAVLRGQYAADSSRLSLIVEGMLKQPELPEHRKCPFCDSDIDAAADSSYVEASRNELNHLRVHLSELEKAESAVADKRAKLEAETRRLEDEKKSVDTLISKDITPRIESLKTKLNDYKRAVELAKELAIIQAQEKTFGEELKAKTREKKTSAKKYDINEDFDDAEILKFDEILIKILAACRYGGYGTAYFDKESCDLVIAEQSKYDNGMGCCAFLNSVIALAFSEYLEERGAYSPGLVILDSPFTQISEAASVEQTRTKKAGLLKYLLDFGKDCANYAATEKSPFPPQIILIEQPDRLPFSIPEDASANVIAYSHDENVPPYGFLPDVVEAT